MEPPRPLSRPRRRTARYLARRLGLRAALTGLLLAALPAASAHAAGRAAVVISGPGGTSFAMSEESLRAGTEGGTYTVRAHPGEAGEAFTRTGVSVRQLIVLAGADPEAIGYVAVPRPDGSSAFLPGADFAAAPPFEGGLPVLVSADSGCIRFLRPLSADPNDVNGEDNIASCGAPLTIDARGGNILSVSASASSTAPEAGTAVRFGAVAAGAKEGEAITYEWSFGDGADAAGQTVSHSFTAAGSYRVAVIATGSEESGGESAPLTIVVGKPAEVGTGAGVKLRRGATLSETEAGGRSPGPTKPEASGPVSEGATSVGPVVEPPPSRTAGRFVRGPADRPHGAPGGSGKGSHVAPTSRTESGAEAEGGAKAEAKRDATEAAVSGPTVRGRLVADFVVPGAAGSAGGGGAGSGAGSLAGAPAGAAGSVPVAALLAAALLAGGGSLQWRRQRGERR